MQYRGPRGVGVCDGPQQLSVGQIPHGDLRNTHCASEYPHLESIYYLSICVLWHLSALLYKCTNVCTNAWLWVCVCVRTHTCPLAKPHSNREQSWLMLRAETAPNSAPVAVVPRHSRRAWLTSGREEETQTDWSVKPPHLRWVSLDRRWVVVRSVAHWRSTFLTGVRNFSHSQHPQELRRLRS